MKTKGAKGFAIVNIIVGAILTIASFVMFADPSTFPGPFIALPLGLAFWICGVLAMRGLRNEQAAEKTLKVTLTANKIFFVLSCIILAACLVLPIIGPML